jgi:hypothetical protein
MFPDHARPSNRSGREEHAMVILSHPGDSRWPEQIVDAFPEDSAPSYLLRDRDSVYGHN